MKHLMYTYPLSSSDLLSSFILAGPFGLVLGTQWAQQPTPRFDARAISVHVHSNTIPPRERERSERDRKQCGSPGVWD